MKPLAKDYARALGVLALAVCVHVVFCASLYYHFLDPLFYVTTHAKGQGGPFFGIYQAGVNLVNGESIYGSDNYSAPTHVEVPYYHFYRYLPFASYVSGVFSKVLKPWPAYWVWVVVNEILLAACIVLTVRLRKIYGAAAVAAAAFWLLYSPMYVELYAGQFCFTMAFFIFLILYPFIRHHQYAPRTGEAPVHDRLREPKVGAFHVPSWLSSGSWIATLLLKSFTVLYTFTFFRIGKRKLAIAGIGAVALTSAPYFIVHRQDLRWFCYLNLRPLSPRLTGGCFGFTGFLRDVFSNATPFLSANLIPIGPFDIAPRTVPLMIILAGIALTTLYLTSRKKTVDPLTHITLWTLTFFLIFKDIWEYHYVILIPLFVALYLETRSKYLLVLFILIALPTPFIFYDVPASEDPQLLWSAPLSLMHHALKSVPTFLFYLWVVKRELSGIGRARTAQASKA